MGRPVRSAEKFILSLEHKVHVMLLLVTSSNPWVQESSCEDLDSLLSSRDSAVSRRVHFRCVLEESIHTLAPEQTAGSPSFLHSLIVHISYPPHPFLQPVDCARAFYYTFRLSFVSLLHTPIAHISFAHIRSSTSSLLHSAFSTHSDCAQCLIHPDSTLPIHYISFLTDRLCT